MSNNLHQLLLELDCLGGPEPSKVEDPIRTGEQEKTSLLCRSHSPGQYCYSSFVNPNRCMLMHFSLTAKPMSVLSALACSHVAVQQWTPGVLRLDPRHNLSDREQLVIISVLSLVFQELKLNPLSFGQGSEQESVNVLGRKFQS